MLYQERGEEGRFLPKSDEPRQVRSIRLTDSTWDKLEELAQAQNISKADLIEDLIQNNLLKEFSVMEILKNKIMIELKVTEQEPSNCFKLARKAMDMLIDKLAKN